MKHLWNVCTVNSRFKKAHFSFINWEFFDLRKFKEFLADQNLPDPTIEADNSDGAKEVPHENHA